MFVNQRPLFSMYISGQTKSFLPQPSTSFFQKRVLYAHQPISPRFSTVHALPLTVRDQPGLLVHLRYRVGFWFIRLWWQLQFGSSSSASVDMAQLQGQCFASNVAGHRFQWLMHPVMFLAGPVQSDTSGGFQLELDSSLLNADITLRTIGGQFVDEATGELTQAERCYFHWLLAKEAEVGGRYLTPESTVVASMVPGMSLVDSF